MDEKDVNSIASAVSNALAKLNADTAGEKGEERKEKREEEETFVCPDCGTSVKGMTKYCPGCGCELEWGE
jgi:rubrerythrin